MTTRSSQTKLAAPGAGLPFPESLVAPWVFRVFRWTHGREVVCGFFREELGRILELARGVSEEEGEREVLILRLPGLEDSSRDWSVFMTLEHLRIVNRAVLETIEDLAGGVQPSRVASTAAVKPRRGAGVDEVGLLEREGLDWLERVQAIGDLKTRVKFAHPWFGPLDASAWHAMAAFHMRLHRKQVEGILAGMGRG